jgi:G3E family GTPase
MSLFDRDRSAERVPVSILTGFLGSGKTTLLNRLLADPAMARSLVLVNEFGEVGLDHLFIEARDSDLVLMQSGCLCCTIKGDLEKTLRDVAAKRQAAAIPEFDRVLIETTGLADPAPIAALFLNHPLVSHDYRLDAVIATVDAVNGARQLGENAESVKQAAIADRLVLTKTDLQPAAATAPLAARLARLNPAAPILPVTHGAIEPVLLFGAGPFDPAGKTEQVRAWLNAERYEAHAQDHDHAHDPDADDEPAHRHDAAVASCALIFDAPLDWTLFAGWLEALRAEWGDRLLRVKGILNVAGEAAPLVIHGVHRVFHPPVQLARWPDADRRSRIVFILRGLSRAEIEQSWRDWRAAAGA